MTGRLRAFVYPSVLFVFFIASCTDGLPPEFPAPEFSLKDIMGGHEVAYSEHRGRAVLIYFFASW